MIYFSSVLEMSLPLATPRICVVDDDVDVLDSVQFLLETEGFEVWTFRSGAATLETVAKMQFDCFVLDYKMPSMSGIVLANNLRDRNVSTPIILITGYPDDRVQIMATVAGIDQVILKPDATENLVPQIRAAIWHDRSASLR
jgi:FixJ family two-component response regulator